MSYFENIILEDSEINPVDMLALNSADWELNEIPKTAWVKERFIPRILVDTGIVKSISEVKRNKPELCINIPYNQYLEIKWGKRKFWILG